ncbi:MAG: tail fiber domain-containing protein [Bacteroidota bacterium]
MQQPARNKANQLNMTIKSLLATCLFLLATTLLQAQVGIGTNSPNASAQLEISSSTKGFLPPRVALNNTIDNTPIINPAVGLLIYNTSTAGSSPYNVSPGYYYYSGSGWSRLINPSDITPQYRVSIGSDAGISTTGGYSVSIGRNANKNWNGSYNTAVGSFALQTITSGSYNQAFGDWALEKRTSGSYATGIGAFALQNLTTGTFNTALGTFAGGSIQTGTSNTLIGHGADVNSPTAVNRIAIGQGAVANSDNSVQLGNSSIGNVYTSGAINASSFNVTSDARLKQKINSIDNAISTVLQLQPYSYEKKSNLSDSYFENKEYGFLAQDIRPILPELVKEGLDTDKTLSVNYIAIIPILTKALQEQQQQIEDLRAKILQQNKKRRSGKLFR